MLHRLIKAWDVILAVAVAGAAYWWLPGATMKDVTTELIAFFGIQSAIILPAMIFTAGILRPDGLSLPEAKRYRKALRSQMWFWIVVLALDFLTVAGLILGKALDWTLVLEGTETRPARDLTPYLTGAVTFLGALAMLRTIPFVRGVLSLLELNSDLTEKAIKRRDRAEMAKFEREAKENQFLPPEGFGRIAERH